MGSTVILGLGFSLLCQIDNAGNFLYVAWEHNSPCCGKYLFSWTIMDFCVLTEMQTRKAAQSLKVMQVGLWMRLSNQGNPLWLRSRQLNVNWIWFFLPTYDSYLTSSDNVNSKGHIESDISASDSGHLQMWFWIRYVSDLLESDRGLTC